MSAETPTAGQLRCIAGALRKPEFKAAGWASDLDSAAEEIDALASQLAQAQQESIACQQEVGIYRAEIERASANLTELAIAKQQLAQAQGEATRLAEVIHRQEYAEEAPRWKPLPDVAGVISQIDNMYAGIRNQRDTLRAELTAAHEACERLREAAGDWDILLTERDTLRSERNQLRAEKEKLRSEETALTIAGEIVQWASIQRGVLLNEFSIRDIIQAALAKHQQA